MCGCVCLVFYDATAMMFANASSWFLYAKAVWVTFGRCTKWFCDGPNLVNKSRSGNSPVRNTFEKFKGLRVCSLAGSEQIKRFCAGHKTRGSAMSHARNGRALYAFYSVGSWDRCASNAIQRRRRWNPTNFAFLELPLLLIDCEYWGIKFTECGVKNACVFA